MKAKSATWGATYGEKAAAAATQTQRSRDRKEIGNLTALAGQYIRNTQHANLPIELFEWSKLAQDRPKWRALITAT
jgi:hypothetical protein